MFFKEVREKSKLLKMIDATINGLNNGEFDELFTEKILPIKLYESYEEEADEYFSYIWSKLNNSLDSKGLFSKPDPLILSKAEILEETILNRINKIVNFYESHILEKAIPMFDIYNFTSKDVLEIIKNIELKLKNNIIDEELFIKLKDQKEILSKLIPLFKEMKFINDCNSIIDFCMFKIDRFINDLDSTYGENRKEYNVNFIRFYNLIHDVESHEFENFIPYNSYRGIINNFSGVDGNFSEEEKKLQYKVDMNKLQNLKNRYDNCSNLNSNTRIII